MTPRERSRLLELLRHTADLEARVKDPEAEALVQAAAAAHPSLAYWFAHRVLLLARMLESDETQIEFLRRELSERTVLRPRSSATPGAGPDSARKVEDER